MLWMVSGRGTAKRKGLQASVLRVRRQRQRQDRLAGRVMGLLTLATVLLVPAIGVAVSRPAKVGSVAQVIWVAVASWTPVAQPLPLTTQL